MRSVTADQGCQAPRFRTPDAAGRPITGNLEFKNDMKTAYELAMERLNQVAPATKLTAAQKKQLAELEATYAATIAGREIALQAEMAKIASTGDAEKNRSAS